MHPYLEKIEQIGFVPVRAKTSRLWPVLERNGQRIMLPPHPLPSGDWVYIDLSDRAAHRVESLLGLPLSKNTAQNYTPPDVDWFDVEQKAKEKWRKVHHRNFNLLHERGLGEVIDFIKTTPLKCDN